jgi:UDP-N-acetylglucosamine--N-acetylmuramyl-(pentapeptide) pyrophosphoryl-undecaprenol N-acetylglucosamine transferase
MATVLVASGGTGGHLFPAVALAQELARRSASTRLVFVGSGRTTARQAALDEGFEWHSVPGRGLPRRGVLGLVPFAWDLLRGVLASRRLVRRLRPAVAVGFGNYGSVAPLYAAHRRHVPIVIHEANALPGKANRLLARTASAVAVQFDEAGRALAGVTRSRVETVGMPVRDALLHLPDAGEARRAYGLDEHAFTLLAMGGSQGARALNEAVCAALPALEQLEPRVQIVHLCGRLDEDTVRAAYEGRSIRSAVRAFETDMARAYAAADCALCRAGAATTAELAVTRTPSLLVPYPHATEDHQARNARVLEQHRAARVVRQEDLRPETVVGFVKDMQDEAHRAEMAQRAGELARPDAAARLADLVEHYIR